MREDIPKTFLIPPVPPFPAGTFKFFSLPISETHSSLHCPQVPSLSGPVTPGFLVFSGAAGFCRLFFLISLSQSLVGLGWVFLF